MKQRPMREVGIIDDKAMLALWSEHRDTLTIAQHLHLPEWFVYNRLAMIRGAMR